MVDLLLCEHHPEIALFPAALWFLAAPPDSYNNQKLPTLSELLMDSSFRSERGGAYIELHIRSMHGNPLSIHHFERYAI